MVRSIYPQCPQCDVEGGHAAEHRLRHRRGECCCCIRGRYMVGSIDPDASRAPTLLLRGRQIVRWRTSPLRCAKGGTSVRPLSHRPHRQCLCRCTNHLPFLVSRSPPTRSWRCCRPDLALRCLRPQGPIRKHHHHPRRRRIPDEIVRISGSAVRAINDVNPG